jgi:uncharacterized membrane protein
VFDFFFLIHILSIMGAFGPSFTYPVIMATASKDPKNVPFATQIVSVLSYRFTIPLALLAGVAGIGMMITGPVRLLDNTWLEIAIVIYVAAVIFAITYQGPNTKKMVELTSKMAGAGPPPEGAPPGPPPAVAALAKKLQIGGTVLGVAVLVIAILMVFKPGAAPNLP